MRTKNKAVLFVVTIIFLSTLYPSRGNCIDKISIKGRDWKLTIYSFHSGLRDLPAVGGLTSIRVPANKEGIEINGEIEPTDENNRLVIEYRVKGF